MNIERMLKLMALQQAGKRQVDRCEHEVVDVDDVREMTLLSPEGVQTSYLACAACELDLNARLKTTTVPKAAEPTLDPCSWCHGEGFQDTNLCTECKGTGWAP